MLKLTELRQGSIIAGNSTYEGKILPVSHWAVLPVPVIFFKDKYIGEFLKDCQPVPLTDKILLACGCNQRDDKDMWGNGYGVWLTKAARDLGYFTHGFRSGRYIHYLHEFQNVVLALTGEEIIFKF